jgi:hypothetical protein
MGSCSSTAVIVPEDQAAYERAKHVIEIRKRVGQRAREDLKKEIDAAVKESIINKEVATEFGKVLKTAMSNPVEANAYADLVGMDANNRRVLQAFAKGGKDAGFKALFTAPDGKRTLTYAESRALYG